MQRVFISISPSHEVIARIAARLAPFKRTTSMRWLDESLWHITVLFLSKRNPREVDIISHTLRDVCVNLPPLDIAFSRIHYGPPGSRPRMVWLSTDAATSRLLGGVQTQLVHNLRTAQCAIALDYTHFNGHITLARFEPHPMHELPIIDELFQESFSASALELMESTLQPSGARYAPLLRVACDG